MNVAYSYVRVYSRALSGDEVRRNMLNPFSPVLGGLEAWVAWYSYNGTHLVDLSGKGRHAAVSGSVVVYPAPRVEGGGVSGACVCVHYAACADAA